MKRGLRSQTRKKKNVPKKTNREHEGNKKWTKEKDFWLPQGKKCSLLVVEKERKKKARIQVVVTTVFSSSLSSFLKIKYHTQLLSASFEVVLVFRFYIISLPKTGEKRVSTELLLWKYIYWICINSVQAFWFSLSHTRSKLFRYYYYYYYYLFF